MTHTFRIRLAALAALLGLAGTAQAQTDGSATFQVTTVTAGGNYAPRNVMAIWVTDANTNFVKTLKRQAQSQIRWLTRWGAVSQSNVVDGITGATLSSHQAHTVTWNCRNTSSNIVADGTYRIFVEFTEFNGAGPFTQAVSFVKGSAGITSTPANAANFTSMRLTYVPSAGPPVLNPIGNRATTVSNVLQFAVSATATGGDPVTLSVSNKPAGALFGSTNVNGTFRWDVPAPVGVHTMTFYAVDKDGAASETIRLYVNPTGSAAFGVALGSPLLSADPADPDQNTAADDLDFERSGGAAQGTMQGGWGDFGRIYFNADASNFYVGGNGLAVGGTSNAMVLLLGFSTLTNDAGNLWSKGGKPAGLDALHNFAVTTPMDIAILLGDEHGDATFSDYNLANGYNFGQGVFNLGATSFTAVAGARISEFDGVEGPTGAPDTDGDRLTERWECAIPWTSLNATGMGSLTSIHVAGLLASSATNGVDRLLSGNVLAQTASPSTNGNYGFGFVTLTGYSVLLAAGHDVAVTAVGPGIANPDSTGQVVVTVSNRQNSTETFLVTVSNVTAGAPVGSLIASNLPPGAATQVLVPWNTAGLALGAYTLRATAGPLGAETATADNALHAVFTLRTPFHDLALASFETPPWIRSGTTSNLHLRIDNLGDYDESVSLVVTDLTDHVLIGAVAVPVLPAYQSTNIVLAWNTGGRSTNGHVLHAAVPALPVEVATANNTGRATVAIAPAVVTNVLLAAGSPWRYRQDGADLSATPWFQTNYYDATWTPGPAPLGFGNGGEATVLATTQRVTHYFRRDFVTDHRPVSLQVRSRHDDGILVYFNGREAARNNLPGGALAFTTTAVLAKGPASEGEWVTLDVGAGHAVAGRNVVAVELHQGGTANAADGEPWINEIHYDNSGSDTNEGIEVAGPAGLNLSGYTLLAYNGADGLLYASNALSGTLPSQSNGYGAVWFAISGLQNGPDAVALTKSGTNVLQLLSYEGSFTTANGPAAGRTTTLLPVVETNTAVGTSLQLGGTGTTYAAFAWRTPAAHTRGLLNTAQGITMPDAHDLALDMEWMAVVPAIPAQPAVEVVQLLAGADAIVGDVVPVSITVSNSGNASVSFQVVLIDTNTSQQVAIASVTNLFAGDTATLALAWPTLNLSTGTHTLAAYTVLNGVTNWAGGAMAGGVIRGTGFGPRPVGASGSVGGFAEAIVLQGAFAYLGEGATLVVLDLGNPLAPVRRGSLRLEGAIRGLAVAGSHVFAACGEAGYHVVDVSSPDAPALAQSFDSSGFAAGVAVSGNTLLLADGISGLRLFDISTPASPTLTGSYATRGPAVAVAGSGSTAYLLDGFEGLLVLDVSTPGAPAVLGHTGPLPNGRALALAGTRALVVDEHAGLAVVDVASPANPALLGRAQLPSPCSAVAGAGSYAYAAAGDAGLLTISLANPASPAVAATHDTIGTASALALGGTAAYVADGFAGLQVFSLSNPANPTPQVALDSGLRARDAVVQDGVACLAAGEEGVMIYSVTNPARPHLLGTLPTPHARRVARAGSILYVAAGFGGVTVGQIADPVNPQVIGQYSNSALVSVHALAVQGNRLALTDGTGIRVLDVSMPAAPSLLASATSSGYAHDLAWCGSSLVVADGPAGVTVRDGATLAILGSYNTSGRALAVRCSGSHAFIADGEQGWLTLDLSTPSAPALVATRTGEPATQLALSGSRLVISGGHGDLRSADIGGPLTPVPADRYQALTRALRVQASPQGLFVSEDDAGLAILQAGDADTDGDGLADWWEQQLVEALPGDELNSIQDVSASADFDGDGTSNRDEYLAGTSPVDENSQFVVHSPAATGGFVVRWNSVVGRTYTLHESTNLQQGFTAVQAGIPATYPVNSHTTSVSGAGSFFMVTTDP